ncbi:MAG: hypothetical protein JWP12_3840 [Bacteroidetes bacterium]|nr:hypothetical protein [Bacteroidota bacterium]
MKKILLSVIAITAMYNAQAQVVFYEDFDGISGPTAGGPGTYSFPTGWTLANVDNHTVNSSVSYMTAAWIRREDFANNVLDSAAFSTSWYSAPAASDDWMITPAIGPLPANVVLSWNALAYDPAYPDGYEVRIMTTAPTGGTGVLGNLVSASTVLFSTTGENAAWTARTVNLAAYAGQTVYISYRNNANDKFLLLIDDVKLEVQAPFDAKLNSVDSIPEYTIIPKNQVTNMPTGATVSNNGVNAITNVGLRLNVYNSALTQIYTGTGATTVASLAPGATTQVSAGNYSLPAIPDTYYFQYVVTHTEADSYAANDTMYSTPITVSDSIYARDNGTVTGSLGIGAGNGGFLGQQYMVYNTAALTSISYYITRGYTGTKTSAVLWNMSGGVPTTVAAVTDTILYPDDSARFYTLPIHGGPAALAPGMYAVTAVEYDSTLALGQASGIFKAGTTWVNWPTSPLGGWAHNEAFGTSFSKPYVIRLNLGPDCSTFSVMASSAGSATCGTCADGSASSSLTGGTSPFTYAWSSGGTAATETGLAPGVYTVVVTDANGCAKTDTVNINNNCTSFSATATAVDASCGTCADGTATATVVGSATATYVWTPSGQTTVTATGLLPGTYTVTVMDGTCSTNATTTVSFSTSIKENSISASTTIYPNPGKDVFTVHIPEEFGAETQITVFNYLGETVYAKMINSFGNKEVNLSGLPSGKYSVRFTSTKYTVNKNLTIIK